MMATTFWEHKGVLMTEFMVQGTTITADVYCETWKSFRSQLKTSDWDCSQRE